MISIKTEEEIKTMKEGGRILADILEKLRQETKAGIATKELENLTRRLIDEAGVEPAFLGFKGYPAALCVSINEEVVHCLPSEKKIMAGDLVSLDLGIKYMDFNFDSAITVLIESADDDPQADLKRKLVRITKECLEIGISMAKPGNRVGDISNAIQRCAEKSGFSVIRDLVGHGVGLKLHEEPEVPNFGKAGKGPKLEEGMVIAIEPMLTTGSHDVVEDKRTMAWKTKDESLSAHFEHTVAITKKGPLVLTE